MSEPAAVLRDLLGAPLQRRKDRPQLLNVNEGVVQGEAHFDMPLQSARRKAQSGQRSGLQLSERPNLISVPR